MEMAVVADARWMVGDSAVSSELDPAGAAELDEVFKLDAVHCAFGADGVEAIAQFRKHQPDITLIDLRIPWLSGAEVIERIRMETPAARFIVLTTYDGDEDICRALQAGASAYLLKGTTCEELIATIRAVHTGRSYIPPAIVEKLAERMGTKELTLREFDVLEQIVHGNNNKEIATELLISETTVKTHINRLLGKLEVTDRTQATTSAIQRGLLTLDISTHRNYR
jgi:DNA-binding NarL/FixJ family response regulator